MTTVQRSSGRKRIRAGIALVPALVLSTALSAHRRDEYLQAARVGVEDDRIELVLELTPGIALAETIIGAIDRNGDGSLSRDEQDTYAAGVLSDVDLKADGRSLRLEPALVEFPDVEAMRRGEGTLRLQSRAMLPSQTSGAHQLLFRNAHRPDISAYLANAVVPSSDRIAVTDQHRNRDQRELLIDYVFRGGPMLPAGWWWLLAVSVGCALIATIRNGLSLVLSSDLP